MYAGLLLMAMVGTASYFSISQLTKTAQLRSQTEDRLGLLEGLAFSIKTSESALRQYLLTGNLVDLQILSETRVRTREAMSLIRNAKLIPEQAELDEVMAERRVISTKALAARQERGPAAMAAAAAILTSDQGRQLQLRTDSLLESTRVRETLSWRDAQANAQRGAALAQYFILAGGLLFLSMLAWVVYVVKHYEEIRKRVEAQLRASETQLRQITDAVPALIGYFDREQRFCFHNRAYEELFGREFSGINGHTLKEVLGAEAYTATQPNVDEVLRGQATHFERVHVTPQGEARHYAVDYFPRYGEGEDQDAVVGFFALGTDITELRRIDRMKTEFVSTVSHELRTPLTSIRGSLGLISGGVAGELPEGVKNLVGIAKSNCERLIRLINDILDSEKIEAGKLHLNLETVGIKPLVQQALVANEGFAAQHRVKLVLHAAEMPLLVQVDTDRLTQVLTNLLSNAVKFSPQGSDVEVSVSRSAGRVRVEVMDHGPGIPEEFRGRIFQKFSQADASDTRQKGGTGLGLNISRSLVEQMGGTIAFSSVTGVGTTFFFELPELVKPAALPQPAVRPAVAKPRILVCEGDADVARLIGIMLEKGGFEVDKVHDATQAQVKLSARRYDAMTLDLKLPGQQGAAFVSALRRDEKTCDLPLVVISAKAEAGHLELGRNPLTVSDWLEKPIDEDLLLASVRRAVTGLAKPRILHVEDDPDIQCIAAAIAEDFAGFEFAATLGEARKSLQERPFDLVLLDLGLGSESGWDLFADIDALDPRPPVIVFSASDVHPSQGRQAEAVLVKADTSNTELLNTIQRVLRISGDPGPTRP